MTTVFGISAGPVALMLLFPLWRIARGPTAYDRLLGASMMGTKTTVLLLLLGAVAQRVDMFVDISLGYGLALLIGTLAVAKYLERPPKQAMVEARGGEAPR